jgi:hypothetical protein
MCLSSAERFRNPRIEGYLIKESARRWLQRPSQSSNRHRSLNCGFKPADMWLEELLRDCALGDALGVMTIAVNRQSAKAGIIATKLSATRGGKKDRLVEEKDSMFGVGPDASCLDRLLRRDPDRHPQRGRGTLNAEARLSAKAVSGWCYPRLMH